jgi:hypothetical protein
MSLRAELLRAGLRIFLKRRTRHFDLAAWRQSMRATEKFVPRPPRRCQSAELNAAGHAFQRVVMPSSHPQRGGYVSGGPAQAAVRVMTECAGYEAVRDSMRKLADQIRPPSQPKLILSHQLRIAFMH